MALSDNGGRGDNGGWEEEDSCDVGIGYCSCTEKAPDKCSDSRRLKIGRAHV